MGNIFLILLNFLKNLLSTRSFYVCSIVTFVVSLQKAFEMDRQTRDREEKLILSAWYNLVS